MERKFDQWPPVSPPTFNILGLPHLKYAMAFAPRHISSAPYFQSEAREEEEWGLDAQYTREIAPWRSGSGVVLHLCFSVSSLLLCSSLWTGIFYIWFSPSSVPSCPLICTFNRGQGKFVRRERKDFLRNGCLLGIPAHSNDLPGKAPLLHLTNPPSPFNCWCAWAFAKVYY